MNRQEVWLVDLPGAAGHEQSGARPALIVSKPVANTILIVPFTSNVKAARFEKTALVKPTKTNGLSVESIALCFQLRVVDAKRLQRKIGSLNETDYARIRKTILELI